LSISKNRSIISFKATGHELINASKIDVLLQKISAFHHQKADSFGALIFIFREARLTYGTGDLLQKSPVSDFPNEGKQEVASGGKQPTNESAKVFVM